MDRGSSWGTTCTSNFQPSTATINFVPTWLILLELPIEYHRPDILRAIGNSLGRFIKFDSNGLSNNNARFARIYVHLDQSKPPPSRIWIGTFCQGVRLADKQVFCYKFQSRCSGSCTVNATAPEASISKPFPADLSDTDKCYQSHDVPVTLQDKHCWAAALDWDQRETLLSLLGLVDAASNAPLTRNPGAVEDETNQNRLNEATVPCSLPANMNILFWNYRGIARPSFTTHFSYLVNAHKPHIVILSETRTNSPNSVTIVHKLPFDSLEILDVAGFTGDIIILWNARDVAINLVDKSSQMINVVAQVTLNNFVFLLSVIYASPKFKHRVNLWSGLNALSQNHLTLPRVCIGDFNEIIDPCEKFGGNSIKWNRVNLFKTSMDSCNLIDLGFSGPKFTWTNKRCHNPILEILDRVWVNQTWLD
ncbi:uncharacterized protein LOC141629570 [Silene latifolia]|uniref:uncharacterized protein LOC141629570 n=1 Tax=Silene latifolia TaxID=37657 RepID=UPI003D7721DB